MRKCTIEGGQTVYTVANDDCVGPCISGLLTCTNAEKVRLTTRQEGTARISLAAIADPGDHDIASIIDEIWRTNELT